ncbi:DUF2975 domain-containing protein [soil metagenome]
MRALGPGSVSSFLKIILDVVYVALWIGIGVVGLLMLAALLLSFNPDLIGSLSLSSEGASVISRGPVLAGGLLALALTMAGLLVIVARLRQIFATLTAGDPFHPDNVLRLRVIGLALGSLELVRYAVRFAGEWLDLALTKNSQGFSLTAWFSVLVVFVLAEVFREGARLRREAELTI